MSKKKARRPPPVLVAPSQGYLAMKSDAQLDYVLDTYFKEPEEIAKDLKKKKDDAYIASLPESDTCPDQFEGCSQWAANDECIINPEFMLYNCPKSCKSCSLTEEEKYNLVKIYNSRPPPHCVFHGGEYISSYPTKDSYLRIFDIYSAENNLI